MLTLGTVRFRLACLHLTEIVRELHSSPSESIDTMFHWFTVIANNMRANVTVLPYDNHETLMVDELLHSLDRTMCSEKVEAILESDRYETLTVDELVSKL
jgi:hypothetical protein